MSTNGVILMLMNNLTDQQIKEMILWAEQVLQLRLTEYQKNLVKLMSQNNKNYVVYYPRKMGTTILTKTLSLIKKRASL